MIFILYDYYLFNLNKLVQHHTKATGFNTMKRRIYSVPVERDVEARLWVGEEHAVVRRVRDFIPQVIAQRHQQANENQPQQLERTQKQFRLSSLIVGKSSCNQ
jgi:ABC-type xylose transport system substrate-binding protein